jgi:hypothetical protein
MTKIFKYEFEEDPVNSLTYEVSLEEDERLDSRVEDGTPILYMNRRAMLTLAKLLIRMAESPHLEQFHVHLRRDFGEGPEVLNVMLYPDMHKAENRS